MHRNSNIIVAGMSLRFLILVALTHLLACADNHRRIEVNFDCHKTNLYFQCRVRGLNLLEGDKNAEIILNSHPSQSPSTDIRIESSSLFFIPPKIFSTFDNVREFIATNCSVREIYHETFSNASILAYLVLSYNNIEIIPDDAFERNSNLQTLKLDHNRIQRLTTNVFRGLSTLRMLMLSFNEITHLPLFLFEELKNLEILELNDNRIAVISAGQFDTNKQLIEIDFSNNALVIVDNGTFDGILDSLKHVNLENNKCVNASFGATSENIAMLIDRCSEMAFNAREDGGKGEETKEDGFKIGPWTILVAFVISCNVAFFLHTLFKRGRICIWRWNRSDDYEMRMIIDDDSFSYHDY